VHEIKDRTERIGEMAREYARAPERTLVISPDNESRREINSQIHRSMRQAGQVTGTEYRVPFSTRGRADRGRPAARAELRTGRCNPLHEGQQTDWTGRRRVCARCSRGWESNTLTITRKSGES